MMQRPDTPPLWFQVANAAACAALTLLAAGLAFNLAPELGIAYYEEQALALAGGIALFMAYHQPSGPGRPPWRVAAEAVLAWALLAASIYFVIKFEDYSLATALQPPEIYYGGIVVILALLEAVRRVAGWALLGVIVVVFGYTLFGQYLPRSFAAADADVVGTVIYTVVDPNAILGAPLRVSVLIVIPFIFMGEVLQRSGGSSFYTDLAMSMVGRAPGGSAKVAVVSSGLLGTISGSAVGNVVTSGVITIPLMKKAGYLPERAAAVEAVASTGGQLMPPVMGAAAFLMIEFVQVPYGDIILAALIPALLYYGSLFFSVDLIARRANIGGIAADAGRAWTTLKQGWFFLAGLLGLMALLISGKAQPEMAAILAAVLFAACGAIFGYGGKRMSFRSMLAAFPSAGKSCVDILIISAAAGIVVGLLNVSGLSFSLSLSLIQLAQDSVILLLIYTAIVSIFLGMGMPTTGVYVLLATVVAPALIKLGILPLAAHFFIFYFGMMSMITPPVAMASFAAASLAQTDPMRTGWMSMMLGWPAFVLPFLMAETEELLFIGNWYMVLMEAAFAALGVAAITAAMMRYFRGRLTPLMRLAYAGLGAICLISVLPGEAILIGRFVAAGLLLFLMIRPNPAAERPTPRAVSDSPTPAPR